MEHLHGVVDEFLGYTHASMVNRGVNYVEVCGSFDRPPRLFSYLRGYFFALGFPGERLHPLAKCADLSPQRLTVSDPENLTVYRLPTKVDHFEW